MQMKHNVDRYLFNKCMKKTLFVKNLIPKILYLNLVKIVCLLNTANYVVKVCALQTSVLVTATIYNRSSVQILIGSTTGVFVEKNTSIIFITL